VLLRILSMPSFPMGHKRQTTVRVLRIHQLETKMVDTHDTNSANEDRAKRTHRVDVQAVRYGARGPVYRILHAGEVLLEGCRCPLFVACRALLAKGITGGRVELWRSGKAFWDLAVDITVGAKLTVVETETEGPRLGKWSVPSLDAISRLRHRARTATDADPVPWPTVGETPILDAEPAS
jgi:hypothetical protein